MVKKIMISSLLLLSIVHSTDNKLIEKKINKEYKSYLVHNTISLSSLKKENNINILIALFKTKPLTKNNVAKAIIMLDLFYPKWVFKQSAHESGWFCSLLAKKYNNIFGMKFPRKRKSYAIGKTPNGYAYYSHWVYSILDYKEWQNMIDASKYKTYFLYLKARKYFEDKQYKKKLLGMRIPDNIQIYFKGINYEYN